MRDLIDRQVAIERIVSIRPSTPKQSDYSHGVDVGMAMAIVAIKEQSSAQPDVPDINVGDTISRQAAIDALLKLTHLDWENLKIIHPMLDVFEQLPSAQPEIVRCKDCKYSEHWYKDKRRCFLWNETGIDVFEDGFCNYARKENR